MDASNVGKRVKAKAGLAFLVKFHPTGTETILIARSGADQSRRWFAAESTASRMCIRGRLAGIGNNFVVLLVKHVIGINVEKSRG